jgi:hypothetical protein
MKKLLSLSVLASSLVLSACGGGGESSDIVDAYIGSWKGCISALENGTSYYSNRTRAFRKVDATHMLMDVQSSNRYSDNQCSVLTTTELVTTTGNPIQLGKAINFLGRNGYDGVRTLTNGVETFYITVDGNSLRIGANVTAGVPTAWSLPYAKQ